MAGPKGETARVCTICGRPPQKGSMNCYITLKEPGFIVYHAVCYQCKQKEVNRGRVIHDH